MKKYNIKYIRIHSNETISKKTSYWLPMQITLFLHNLNISIMAMFGYRMTERTAVKIVCKAK